MARIRMRNRLFAAVSALAAGLMLVLIPLTTASAAPGAVQPAGTVAVHLKQASLADHVADCSNGASSAHIILNQIAPAAAVPASISVVLSHGTTVTAPLWKYTGSTAHYDVPLTAGQTVTDAVAYVPTGWTGQFVLSNYDCAPGTTTTTTTTTTSTQPTS
jgi:hypothetical protein